MSNNTFDKAIEVVLNEAADKANKQIDKQGATEEVVFSKEHEDKMKALFRKEKNKLLRKKIAKVSKIAAMFVLVLAISAGVAIYNVEAWRDATLNFFFDKDAPNTDFFIIEGGQTIISGDITFNYVPEDFEVVEEEHTIKSSAVVFENDKQYFRFDVEPGYANVSYDTEDGVIEELKIQGVYEGVFIRNPRINILVWHDGENIFSVSGNIIKGEMIKIAENMKRK